MGNSEKVDPVGFVFGKHCAGLRDYGRGIYEPGQAHTGLGFGYALLRTGDQGDVADCSLGI